MSSNFSKLVFYSYKLMLLKISPRPPAIFLTENWLELKLDGTL